ncbi:DoxX family protein [Candidatus Pacearchaeota archaeon]|nr:DoxX family protein [Candidatus Pacearchaeota archaeon]
MNHKSLLTGNRVLLGLVMLVHGLMTLFVMGSDAIAGMLSEIALFSWAPVFWAWVLILSEVVFGIAILASWRLKYTVWPPVVIMVVAAFTVSIKWQNTYGIIHPLFAQSDWPGFLMHLALASNYLLLKHSK